VAKLINAETGAVLGEISEEQLDFLIDELEEEDSEDQDYYLDLETIDLLEESGAEDSLITLLRSALGSSEGIEVRWTR
jgi:hypothetical protein